MSKKDMQNNSPAHQGGKQMPLSKLNYIWMLAGLAVIIVGFILMAGGGSSSPDEFNYAMFSFRRITLAPIIVLAGFGVEIYAIMKRFPGK